MDENMNEENGEMHLIGDLSPQEVKRFLENLKAEGIPWELEADDSAIRTLSPQQARHGGTFGTGVRIRVFVPRDHRLHACQVYDELFRLPLNQHPEKKE